MSMMRFRLSQCWRRSRRLEAPDAEETLLQERSRLPSRRGISDIEGSHPGQNRSAGVENPGDESRGEGRKEHEGLGLSEGLLQKATLEEIRRPTPVSNLVLISGEKTPPNPRSSSDPLGWIP